MDNGRPEQALRLPGYDACQSVPTRRRDGSMGVPPEAASWQWVTARRRCRWERERFLAGLLTKKTYRGSGAGRQGRNEQPPTQKSAGGCWPGGGGGREEEEWLRMDGERRFEGGGEEGQRAGRGGGEENG